MIRVRAFTPADGPALRAIFQRAVMEGAACCYGAAQRAAWAGHADTGTSWDERLGDEITVIAERGDAPVGFMTLGRDGHLDLAFVLPEAMGTGVAAALHDRLIERASATGLSHLTTEASHLARRFFLKQGWREGAAQSVTLDGVELVNFRMEKRLMRPGSG